MHLPHPFSLKGTRTVNDSVSMMVAIALFMVMKYGFTKRDQSLKITHLVMEYVITVGLVLVIQYIMFGLASISAS
jgi:hypothetical protein